MTEFPVSELALARAKELADAAETLKAQAREAIALADQQIALRNQLFDGVTLAACTDPSIDPARLSLNLDRGVVEVLPEPEAPAGTEPPVEAPPEAPADPPVEPEAPPA